MYNWVAEDKNDIGHMINLIIDMHRKCFKNTIIIIIIHFQQISAPT